jgi:hypothetical protein
MQQFAAPDMRQSVMKRMSLHHFQRRATTADSCIVFVPPIVSCHDRLDRLIKFDVQPWAIQTVDRLIMQC